MRLLLYHLSIYELTTVDTGARTLSGASMSITIFIVCMYRPD